VADATEQTVRVQFGSHRVRGMVVDEEDAPVADCMVSEVDTGEATATAPDGTFELVLQPDTHARVRAIVRNRTSQVESISFEETTIIDGIILELSSRSEAVVVRVIDQDGNPAQGAYVIHQTDTGDSSHGVADESGAASVRPRSPDFATHRAAAYWNQQWVLGSWCSASGEIDLQIGQTGSLLIERSDNGCNDPLGLTAGEWDLAALLQSVGLQQILSRRGEVIIPGLPEGSVTTHLCGTERTATIRKDEVAEVGY
jgi:hypothetical protein